ncbi:hypothetical protein [Clavibacter capsici]|uniref:hypothetical protein n=1 Tax=Clavibacter capsici TaxID=1874630 RepID=UPI0014284F2E|nr:hypothetical protein [Clavibacter capsici]QIS40703.1 hypothetical protein GW571_00270 [Clavibacter capsici]
MHRHLMAIAATLSVVALASCSAADDRAPEPNRSPQDVADELSASMQQSGHATYGALAGSGDQPQSSAIQISGERAGLAVYAKCSGTGGEATVRIADGEPLTMACDAGQVQVLDPDVALVGARLTLSVEGAPPDSLWAIAAGAPDAG